MAEEQALARIEQLLQEGNDLRRQAILLQEQALAVQRSLVEEQRANILKAQQVNEQALSVQNRARRIQQFIIPALVLLIGYVSWILFFRLKL